MIDIKKQNPATKNQIQNNKPSIIKNSNIITGVFANSVNGGMIKPICYKYVMAGEKHMEYRLRVNIKMLTPKTPVLQALKATFKAYFVPNSRVWENAEKFISQKGGASEVKIKKIPNFEGVPISPIRQVNSEEDIIAPITDTDLWRDSWFSTYIPRYQTGATAFDGSNVTRNLPRTTALTLRGFKAIYNDYERNKEYDEPFAENKSDTITSQDRIFNDIGGTLNTEQLSKLMVRGKRQNSYYTDYRTELLGFDGTEPILSGTNDLMELTEWEKLISEARSQAENAQLNDWDIISKIRGSKPLTEGKVQLLGTKTIPLNYQSVEQTVNNLNGNIEEENQVLGTQGAYSYTEVDLPLYQMHEFKEEGYIHVIMQVTSDTVFETAFDRTNLNVNWDDIYRPDLKDLKNDVLFEIEKCGTRIKNANDLEKVTGFKRKFSEYFKAPDSISGDLCTRGYYITQKEEDEYGFAVHNINNEGTMTNSQRSFQFFETDDKETARFQKKHIWQDYTDILINKNQAVMQEEEYIEDPNNPNQHFIRVKGDNQIFFYGKQVIIANLPIDESIKNNFTKWGEK